MKLQAAVKEEEKEYWKINRKWSDMRIRDKRTRI
jgi:hypothetical protein